MKKCILIAAACFAALPFFSASYEQNEYQRKSVELTQKADSAFANGDYDAAILYAKEAEKNAQLSAEYIQRMMSRTTAFNAMNRARTRLKWAANNKAATRFPDAYTGAAECVRKGGEAFNAELYDDAVTFAAEAVELLAVVSEQAPLPAEYRVRPTKDTGDCLWNIAKNPAVYGDPFKWTELFNANKSKFPDSKNPDWIEPGMIIIIPSLSGEFRSGTYDPAAEYIPYKEQTAK